MKIDATYEETEALILRRSEYSESSFVIGALTPNRGRQDFLLKGARKHQRRQFIEVDLFRHVAIVYRPHAGGLHATRDVSCITAFDGVTADPQNYAAATWLARFVMANIYAGVPAPRLFAALKLAFARLSTPTAVSPLAIRVAVCFVHLSESGLLPAYNNQPEITANIDAVMAFAATSTVAAPNYSESTWRGLMDWTRHFIEQHTEMQLPKTDWT